jgi:2'-hydroxyisoflavone reductase
VGDMRVLVIGGTRFLGPAVVEAALARGDEVTTFSRGLSGTPPAGVTALRGDREDPAALEQVRGREFDVVVDTCGYTPSVVGASAALLADSAAHYVFVSTVNVYPDFPERAITAGSPVWDCPADATGPPPELTDAGPYGYLKAGCERAVEQHFPGRSTQVRAGLLIGPRDDLGRMTYWLDRISRGGPVAVPGPPEWQLAFMDVRDLAPWMLDAGAAGHSGAYNASGPKGMTTYRELFESAVAVTGSDAELVWIPEDVLLAHEVRVWRELPFWLPPTRFPHTFDIDVQPILDAGLTVRPIAESLADIWAWQREIGPAAAEGKDGETGLSPEREAELITALITATEETA